MRRLFVIGGLLFGMLFRSQAVYGCSPSFETNHWYREEFVFDSADLPDSFQLIQKEFSEGEPIVDALFVQNAQFEVYAIQPREYEQLLEVEEGSDQFAATVRTSGYLLRSGDYFLPSDVLTDLKEHNPQSPGGSAKPPSPIETELWLATANQIYRVPFTVRYTLNPEYDPSKLVWSSSIEDVAIVADYIVVAEPIERVQLDADNGWIPSVEFQVEMWLKGRGDGQILIGTFGDSATCLSPPPTGRKLFFLSEARDGTYSYIRFVGIETVTQAKIDRISAIAQQEPYLIDITHKPASVARSGSIVTAGIVSLALGSIIFAIAIWLSRR